MWGRLLNPPLRRLPIGAQDAILPHKPRLTAQAALRPLTK
jgi:hypothetical protein